MSTDPLNIGVTAMEAYDVAMDVSANNIANVGTPGFQADAVEFQNLYAGAVAARVGTSQTPGAIDPTGAATDVAISGTGYFVLAGPNNSTTYTRNGGRTPSMWQSGRSTRRISAGAACISATISGCCSRCCNCEP